MLPPRSVRGILPRRDDSYHLSKYSKYPIANMAKGSLSTFAQAYSAAVYSKQLPKNVQETLGHKEWKDAMNVQMGALEKMELGRRLYFL